MTVEGLIRHPVGTLYPGRPGHPYQGRVVCHLPEDEDGRVDLDAWDAYLADARRAIDALAETCNPAGVEIALLAMIHVVATGYFGAANAAVASDPTPPAPRAAGPPGESRKE